jgi:uncharacterized protein (DUF4415 family)
MEKKRVITRYTSEDLAARRAKGESRTDTARVLAKTETDLERDTASDRAFDGVPADWYKAAEAAMPVSKKLLSLRLDTDLVEWFREQGPGYQTRINAVLRAFVTQQVKKGRRAA